MSLSYTSPMAVIGIVLAAGQGSRFAAAKPGAPFKLLTLIVKIARAFHASSAAQAHSRTHEPASTRFSEFGPNRNFAAKEFGEAFTCR